MPNESRKPRVTFESAPAVVPQFLLYGERPQQHQPWFVNIEHLAERCRDRGWRIEPHAHPDFGQLMFAPSGRGVIAQHRLADSSLTSLCTYCSAPATLNSNT